ncbi:MAG: amino acid permease [Solirubrobacteraceae bacterium]
MSDHHPGPSTDDSQLESFGYRPELKRTLRPWAVFGVAFSFMSITTSIYTVLGFGLGHFGTASVWFWLPVFAGQILIALVLAELGSRIPLAGYSYQWGSRLISPGYGWLIAAAAFVYLLTSASTITYVLIGPFIGSMLGVTLSSLQTLLIALGALVLIAAVNIVGVRLFARINSVAVVAEICAALFIALAVLIVVFAKHGHGMSLTNNGGVHGGAVWPGIEGALAVGLFSLTGFETAADMSEEAVGATGSVPRAVIGSLGVSGVVGFIALIGFSVGVPNITAIANSGSPVFDIMTHWFGTSVARILLIFPLLAVFGTALAVVAVQGRLLFALARDNVAPGSRFLRTVNKRTKTPVAAILVGTLLTAAMLVYAYKQTSAFTVLVGATSILPYVVYILLIGAYAVRRRALASLHRPGLFTLGRWSVPVFVLSFAWLVFALWVLTVPADFHKADRVVGGVLVLAILWYLLVLRRRIKAGRAGTGHLTGAPPPGAETTTEHPTPGVVAVTDSLSVGTSSVSEQGPSA